MNVVLFFTEPRLSPDGFPCTVQTESGKVPEISLMGLYCCQVPEEQLLAFQQKVAQKGGKPEFEKSKDGTLHYSFHGIYAAYKVNQLATPFMSQS